MARSSHIRRAQVARHAASLPGLAAALLLPAATVLLLAAAALGCGRLRPGRERRVVQLPAPRPAARLPARSTGTSPTATGSPAQKLDLYLPQQGETPYPVVIAIHGGGFLSGDKADGQITPVLEALRRGYAVAGVNYRLSGEATFPAAINDVKAAIRWLRAHAGEYDLDPAASPPGGTRPAATWRRWPARPAATPPWPAPTRRTPVSPTGCRPSSTGTDPSRSSRPTATSAWPASGDPAPPAQARSSPSTSGRRWPRSRAR